MVEKFGGEIVDLRSKHKITPAKSLQCSGVAKCALGITQAVLLTARIQAPLLFPRVRLAMRVQAPQLFPHPKLTESLLWRSQT